MKLLILESPSKRKTIQGFLGPGWRVEASFGHVTELANDGPDSLGFDITTSGVEPRYVPRGKQGKKRISRLKQLSRQAETVYFATDPDREGEAISWHLIEAIGLPQNKVRRVRYSEITEQAVTAAIANASPTIDHDLANAARARQVLDKLVGYKVSPLLWDSSGGKSAGRVQSAALAIASKREREIETFEPQPYWSISARYKEGLVGHFLGTEVSEEDDSDNSDDDAAESADRPAVEGRRIWQQSEAERLAAISQESAHRVVSCESKKTTRKPPAPFTTSTLQQSAGSKLGLTANQVMRLAQQLFEGIDLPQGRKSLITYHRTDAPVLSNEFKAAARAWLEENDLENVPEQITSHKAKKGAQAAHEAIRPTYLEIPPNRIRKELSEDQYRLYRLIWQRAISTCCRHARLQKTRIVVESGGVYWEAKGQVVEFEGYAKYWSNLGQDQELPELQKGQVLKLSKAKVDERQTSAPPRYSEARIVQTLERLGVGRPSTFAATLQTLKRRKYVRTSKRKLVPTEVGMNTYRVLARTVPDLLDSDFTAEMESALDAISEGKQNWEKYLCEWNQSYFEPALRKAEQIVEEDYSDMSNQSEITDFQCPVCEGSLETYSYEKDGNLKTMLRCHNASTEALKDKAKEGCEDVAFFESRGAFWSPTYGEIGESNIPDDEVLEDRHCPVCQGPLEKHYYPKDGNTKSMLRCHEKRQQDCSEVAFFQTEGGYWSPKYGELSELQEAAEAA